MPSAESDSVEAKASRYFPPWDRGVLPEANSGRTKSCPHDLNIGHVGVFARLSERLTQP